MANDGYNLYANSPPSADANCRARRATSPRAPIIVRRNITCRISGDVSSVGAGVSSCRPNAQLRMWMCVSVGESLEGRRRKPLTAERRGKVIQGLQVTYELTSIDLERKLGELRPKKLFINSLNRPIRHLFRLVHTVTSTRIIMLVRLGTRPGPTSPNAPRLHLIHMALPGAANCLPISDFLGPSSEQLGIESENQGRVERRVLGDADDGRFVVEFVQVIEHRVELALGAEVVFV